jgi:hypothetical protein
MTLDGSGALRVSTTSSNVVVVRAGELGSSQFESVSWTVWPWTPVRSNVTSCHAPLDVPSQSREGGTTYDCVETSRIDTVAQPSCGLVHDC